MKEIIKNRDRVFEEMKNGKIGKVFFIFALPSILSLLVGDFYNVANTHFLNVFTGSSGVATLAITGNFFLFLIALSYLFSTGTQILLSIAIGQNDQSKEIELISLSLFFTLLISFILSFLGMKWISQLLIIFATPKDLYLMTHAYVQVTLIGLPVILIYFLLFGIFSSYGRFILILVMSALFCVSNIIFVPWSLKHGFGLGGVAWVNVLASLVIDIILIGMLVLEGKLSFEFLKTILKSISFFGNIMYVGMAYFVPFFTKIIVMTLMLHWMQTYHSVWLLASWGAYFRFYMFLYMAMIGLRQAAMPIFAYFKGYNNDKSVEVYYLIVKWVGNIAMLIWIVLLIFIDPIMKYQLNDIYGKHILLIMCIALPFAGIETLSLGFLQTQLSIKLTLFLDILDKITLLIVTVVMVSFFGKTSFYFVFLITSIIMCTVLYRVVTYKKLKLSR